LKWVTINVPNIEVKGDFYISVFAYTGPFSWGEYAHPQAPKGGIAIGLDFDTKSGNSFVVANAPNEIKDWETFHRDIRQEDTDLMIRVVTAQGTATSKTIYVDDDFTDDPINHKWNTIQEGIDDADSGDTIIVKSGRYPEHLVIDKRVTLKGGEYPTVDGEGIETVISIRTDRVHIDGLNVIRCDPARENMEEGIRVSVNNCVINDCIISDHNIGLSTGGKDNVISNCKFHDNRISLVIHNGERNTVKKNHFTNGNLILDGAKNNLIASNIIELDPHFGINIYNKSEYNTIEGNTIQSNSIGAIEIVESEWGPTSHNNRIYHNNILDNGCECQACDEGTNQWDNGYPSGGNYWSDYTGTDADGDGIGDTPYNIDGGTGAQDRYPFIQ
jgi:parallel beta-helix repeat protein